MFSRKNKPSIRFQEDDLQMSVASYLDRTNLLWCHVPNERKSSIQAGVRNKKKGVKRGVPDVLIFETNKKYNGLAIELKIIKDRGFSEKTGKKLKPIKTKASDEQLMWLCNLSSKGWYTTICYTFDEVLDVVDKYVNNLID